MHCTPPSAGKLLFIIIISQRDFPRAAGQEERHVQKTQLSVTASPAANTARPDPPPSPSPPQQGFHLTIHISPFLRLQKQMSQIHTNTNPYKSSFKSAECHMERALFALAQDLFIPRESNGPYQFHQLHNGHQHHQPILVSQRGGPFHPV